MGERKKYLKKASLYVVAVRLDLDTEGFTYQKWGGTQTCKAGDWLVDNQGDTYTVDGETFAKTYRRLSPGVYAKATPVWAEEADRAGRIRTKEGLTHYEQGDYIVFNDEDGSDGYAISRESFEEMYEPADGEI
jgi:hypothetical protein